uniref:CHZ domain-containing protein n=1 Tax=Macrostomum lignano TaxID=282301 RepID=A0A1I8GXJ7_9PLAT
MDDQSSETVQPQAESGAFFLTNAESNENAPTVQTEGENSDAEELEESKEELLASNDDQQEEESITNDTAGAAENPEAADNQEQPEATENQNQPETNEVAHEDVDPEADANDISSTTADAKDQQLPERADSPAKETEKSQPKTQRKKKKTKIGKASKPKAALVRQIRSKSAEPIVKSKTDKKTSVSTKANKNDDKATIKKKPEQEKPQAGKDSKTEARHVSFETPRQRSKSVVIPPVSNQIKMVQKLAELQSLISRDYQLEARLCYKRGLAESGCSALLRRWALEAEEQRQRQQQQQQPAASPEASRRQIVRPETGSNRLSKFASTAASPRRESSSRSGRQSREQNRRLPPVNG